MITIETKKGKLDMEEKIIISKVEKKSDFYINLKNEIIVWNKVPNEFRSTFSELKNLGYFAIELHYLSDEKIEEGDYKYNSELNHCWQHNRKEMPERLKKLVYPKTKKVLYSTGVYLGLEKIPENILEKFIKNHNKIIQN